MTASGCRRPRTALCIRFQSNRVAQPGSPSLGSRRNARASPGMTIVCGLLLRQFPQRQFELGALHEGAGLAAPGCDAAAHRFALIGVATGLQPVAIAKRRPYAWMPHILGPQHLER